MPTILAPARHVGEGKALSLFLWGDFVDPPQALCAPIERGAQPEPMASPLIQMQFKGNAVFSQGGSKENTVFKGDAGVFPGVPNETGGCIG